MISGGSSRSSGRMRAPLASTTTLTPTIVSPRENVGEISPGMIIRIASSSPTSSTAIDFTPTHAIDTDASERLLPRPARAAARAAALAASGGLGSGTISHRRFLTLHRRKRRKPSSNLAPHRVLLDDQYSGPTQSVLGKVGEWEFNAFALDSVTGGRPVSVLCVYLLHKYDLINTFKLDTVTVWKCFSLIEEGYHITNPYHNAVHAADVTQAMHCYLQEPTILSHLTPMETLAALIAAVCHDLDHPGVNQPFLIATDNHLAALYKNLSVLENHHWRCAMGCLWESGFLENWEEEQVMELQTQIRSLILATDITRQQEFLTKFKKYQESDTMSMTVTECRHFSLQIALKCADICNPCRSWDISKKWSQKICDEFYRQGDYERQLNIPVTALCDRYSTSVAKIQTGFIEFVVCPLFSSWHSWLGTSLSTSMMKNLKGNLQRWQEKMEEDATLASTMPSPTVTVLEPEGVINKEIEEPVADVSPPDVCSSLSVPKQTEVGRRHSLPLNIPSIVPRTVMRRESLSSDGQPIVLETVTMDGMQLSSLSQPNEEDSSPSPSDSVFPITTNMSDSSSVGSSRNKLSGNRRMSLPPLLYHKYKLQTTPLQTLPATPSLEDIKVPGVDEEEEEKEEKTVGAVEEASPEKAEDVQESCEDAEMTDETITRSSQTPLLPPQDRNSSFTSSFNKHTRHIASSLLRRASLDNSNCTNTNDNLNILMMRNQCQVINRALSNLKKGDKENRYPLGTKGRTSQLPRTKQWRSLTCEEENDNKVYSKLIQHHAPHLQSAHTRGRRGSAPLLNELRGANQPVRGAGEASPERSSLHHTKRRASAPTHNLLHALLSRQKVLDRDLSSKLKVLARPSSQHGMPPPSSGRAKKLLLLKAASIGDSNRNFAQDIQCADDLLEVDETITDSVTPTCTTNLLSQRKKDQFTRANSLPIFGSPLSEDALLGGGLLEANRNNIQTAAVNLLQFLSDVQQKQNLTSKGSDAGEMLPEVASRLGLDNDQEFGRVHRMNQSTHTALPTPKMNPLGVNKCYGGTGGGGGGYGGSDYYIRDFRRGSAGGEELLSELIRYNQDCGRSQDSNSEIGDWYSSGSGGTPSTPGGCVPLPPYTHRRGSLPCDFSFSGELRVFQLETS